MSGDRLTRNQRLEKSATQRDLVFFEERERERKFNAEKTARLRALRLAKEESDKAAAPPATGKKKPAPRKRWSETLT